MCVIERERGKAPFGYVILFKEAFINFSFYIGKKAAPILNTSYKYRKRYNKRLFKYVKHIQYFIRPYMLAYWQKSKNFSYEMIKFYYNKFCIIWSDVKNRNIINVPIALAQKLICVFWTNNKEKENCLKLLINLEIVRGNVQLNVS